MTTVTSCLFSMNFDVSTPKTPRNKFRQAMKILRERAKLYSWSTRHLAYKFLKAQGYRYQENWKDKNLAFWTDIAF